MYDKIHYKLKKKKKNIEQSSNKDNRSLLTDPDAF